MASANELHPIAMIASQDLHSSVKQALSEPDIKNKVLQAFTEYVTLAQQNKCVAVNDYKNVSKEIADCILEYPKVIVERHFDNSYASKLTDLQELGELRLPFPKITIISGERTDTGDHSGPQIVKAQDFQDGLVNVIYSCFLVQHTDHIALHVLFCKQHEVGRKYYAATALLCIDENNKIQIIKPSLTSEKEEDQIDSALSSMAYHAIIAIHMLTVAGGEMYISAPTPDEVAINKKRINKGKKPLIEFKLITVDGKKSALPSTPHGTHASPRLHWRRGHWRTMKKSGKKVWVDPMLVGDEKNGKIIKDYAVGKYEEQKHVHH